jgi:hypothetical protein
VWMSIGFGDALVTVPGIGMLEAAWRRCITSVKAMAERMGL